MSSSNTSINENIHSPRSRYLASTKKKHYLGSVDENIEMLQRQQINELTNILISQKSEYDLLVNQCSRINKETEELSHKIDLMIRMDKKAQKQNNEAISNNETIKEIISTTQQKLNEELYTKKTLTSILDSLTTDALINYKQLSASEVMNRNLKSNYMKLKDEENTIREKKNSLWSKVSSQKEKNAFDKKENNLQLSYYQTIIEQKWMFMQAADLRKERQKKIAQEAKNDSQDKQETEKRRMLGLLFVLDNYLKFKMETEMKQNEKIENSFQRMRDLCGTANLKIMVDSLLINDKQYNSNVIKVMQEEKKKEILLGEINLLEKEFNQLKSEGILINFIILLLVIINENTVGTKDIEVIKLAEIEEKDTFLTQKEIDLSDQYNEYQEIYRIVLTVHDQVISNIKKLCQITAPQQMFSADNSTINTNANDPSFNNSQIRFKDEQIISAYIDYLDNTEKIIDKLFLCHTKKEFLNLMKEKGYEMYREASKTKLLTQGRVIESILSPTNKSRKVNNEYQYQDEENLIFAEKKTQKDIYNAYLNEIKTARDNFVNNIQELKK